MAADPFAPGGELFELFHSNTGNNDHGLKIDNKLLIDLDQLIFGPKIFNSSHSIVFEGLYKSEPVAIKVIKPDNAIKVIKPDKLPALNSKGKDKFEREVTVHSRARNDNIVKFIGASVEPALMIITELMRGGTLLKYLLAMRPNCLDLELSLHFALGISEVMIYLHAKAIIHRDLKPSNILLSEDKNKVKIADFGLAREVITGDMSTEAGTYRWMAPENLRPSTNDVPQEIVPLLESCWAEDPADRPEFIQIKHFLENFMHCLRPIETTPPRMPEMERPTESNVPRNRNSQCTDHPMEKHKKNNKKTRKPCSRCFSCFRSCSDKLKE